MRRIAVINQKGGVGKTTTTANLGAALAQQGRRVVVVDMDAQANLSLSLNVEAGSDAPSTYSVLSGTTSFREALRPTSLANLTLMPSNIDLSGAELELASAIGREYLMKDALAQWESEARATQGRAPADYVIFDCPPSLGLLSINALAAAGEVLITLQTEFLALQGMSKLVEIVQLLRRRLNPELVITGILPCLYDSRLKLAREVLGEIRAYFPGQVFPHPVRSNVKLAEAPSYGKTIFEYAPDSNGASDYRLVAREVIARETRDPDLAGLPPFRDLPAAPSVSSANSPFKRPPLALRASDADVEGPAPTASEPAGAAPPALAPARALAKGPAHTRSRATAAAVPDGALAREDEARVPVANETAPAGRLAIVHPTDVLAHEGPARAGEGLTAAVDPQVGPAHHAAAIERGSSAPVALVEAPGPSDMVLRDSEFVGQGCEKLANEALEATTEPRNGHAHSNDLIEVDRTVPVRDALLGPVHPQTALAPERLARTAFASTQTATTEAPAADVGDAIDSVAESTEFTPDVRGTADSATNAAQIGVENDTASASDASLREVVLVPARAEQAPERRILRAEDLPPLPPDAFEILTSYVHER